MEARRRSRRILRICVTVLGRLRTGWIHAQSFRRSVYPSLNLRLLISVVMVSIRARSLCHRVSSRHGVGVASARQARAIKPRKVRPGTAFWRALLLDSCTGCDGRAKWTEGAGESALAGCGLLRSRD